MTEETWLTHGWPQDMLEYIRDRTSNCKLRLVACAYARHCWDSMCDPRSRAAVEFAEQMADGIVDARALTAVREAAAAAAAEAYIDATGDDAFRAVELARPS